MRILKICLDNPSEGRKGDAKLISERARYLERRGVVVDLLYFNYTILEWCVDVGERQRSRLGKDIIIRVGFGRVCWNMISGFGSLKELPVQTWLSFALARSTRGLLRKISQKYDAVHIYHIRSIGLWREIPAEKDALYDIIDSYSLNLRCRLLVEKSSFWRGLLSIEYKRMTRLENRLEDFISNPRRASIVAVAAEDLHYVNSAVANKRVVPVGVNVKTSSEESPVSFKELRCIFFGNLDYEPNINACLEIKKLAEAVNAEVFGGRIKFTVAGRNISRRLACELRREDITILSPVKDMMEVVKDHNIALIPMISGSGMQSKVLEALQWGCLLIATQKAVIPLSLEEGKEYILWKDIESTVGILKSLLDGQLCPEEILMNGRESVGRFSWENTCAELIRIYKSHRV